MASTSPSVGAYLGEGLKGVVAILHDISDDLPAPASAIINLVQHVINLVEVPESIIFAPTFNSCFYSIGGSK